MTMLTIYADDGAREARRTTTDFVEIAAALADTGVRVERWAATADFDADATDAQVLSAYGDEIDRLKAAGGYNACDIVRLTPDHPAREEMRSKFLSEHVHDDDEVRFFVAGSGLFYIRAGGAIHALECTRGDLIVLPAGMRHWFDTGARPSFTAIRLFTRADGWVARFTGDPIAEALPLYEGAV
jgi:1,2-dihydroxy-3-keto-5-methylthiopentene dioxygenase